MHILVSNDDGIHARGLRALAEGLLAAGHRVTVSAPDRERSCAGHALTLREPLYARRVALLEGVDAYEVSGTPADCAKLGIENLSDGPVDMVLSGINQGSNLGSDTIYSGTVAAAMEAALLGYRTVAVSIQDMNAADFSGAVHWALRVMDWIVRENLPGGVVYNLNVPGCAMKDIKGLRIAELALKCYEGGYEKRTAPYGIEYYWLKCALNKDLIQQDSDAALVHAGYATLTPLTWSLMDDALRSAMHSALAVDQP